MERRSGRPGGAGEAAARLSCRGRGLPGGAVRAPVGKRGAEGWKALPAPFSSGGPSPPTCEQPDSEGGGGGGSSRRATTGPEGLCPVRGQASQRQPKEIWAEGGAGGGLPPQGAN